mgnify:CR=1 FL=1
MRDSFLPEWLTVPRLLLLAGALVFGILVWPDAAPTRDVAQAAAVKAALAYRTQRAMTLRQDSLWRKRLAAHNARPAIDTALPAVPTFVGVKDSTGKVIIGPPNDTLITVPEVRRITGVIADSAHTIVAALEAHIADDHRLLAQAEQNAERFRMALALADSSVAASEAARRAAIPSWPVRAVHGLEHLGAGVALGAVGYVLGGPLAGLGGAILGAAIAGVVR